MLMERKADPQRHHRDDRDQALSVIHIVLVENFLQFLMFGLRWSIVK